ncbi:hypothetical protein PanWU01x14_236480, partial [Parasponia andersonii]
LLRKDDEIGAGELQKQWHFLAFSGDDGIRRYCNRWREVRSVTYYQRRSVAWLNSGGNGFVGEC